MNTGFGNVKLNRLKIIVPLIHVSHGNSSLYVWPEVVKLKSYFLFGVYGKVTDGKTM